MRRFYVLGAAFVALTANSGLAAIVDTASTAYGTNCQDGGENGLSSSCEVGPIAYERSPKYVAITNSSVDASTGELKAATTVTGDGEFIGMGSGTTVSARGLIRERFTLGGSGTLTAFMRIDGNYAIGTADTWSGFAGIQINDFGPRGERRALGQDRFRVSSGAFDPRSGSIDELLTFSIELKALSETYEFQSEILSIVNRGSGMMDLGNTGKIFLRASEGLTINFETDGFLRDPAFLDEPKMVFAPGAMGLSMIGLIGLVILRRQKLANAVT